jgi:hypothetical protein
MSKIKSIKSKVQVKIKKYAAFLLLTFAFCFLTSNFSFAATFAPIAKGINVSVFVQGGFSMTIDTDSFDFSSLTPGQSGDMNRAEGIMVAGESTSGTPWVLKVTAAKPLSSGQYKIANEYFSWAGTSKGRGEWMGNEERTLADANSTAYISTGEEADTASKVANNFKFHLTVPEDTRPGNYTSLVMFTMTE